MKILVTGANGQLGSELRRLAPSLADAAWIYTDIGELDITSFDDLDKFISREQPDAIINCAAYTAVDKAESDVDTARLINVGAASHLAHLTRSHRFKLVHISTDFVFDGTSAQPYREDDPTGPVSVYGKTKLEGERSIAQNAARYVIVRTSWLYSPFGNNFVKTIIRLARERGKLNIVADQVGTPTYAGDLARIIITMVPRLTDTGKDIYHFSNEGVASWYDFAVAICEFTGIPCTITPIPAKEYPTPAARPHFSVLDKGKIKKNLDITIPYWRDSLKECIATIIEGETCIHTNH